MAIIEPMKERSIKSGGKHTPIIYKIIVALLHWEILTAPTMHVINRANPIPRAGITLMTEATMLKIAIVSLSVVTLLNIMGAKKATIEYIEANTIVKIDKTNIGTDKNFFCILK
ncbi:hypothetical protein U5U50_01345 [Mycoplasma sp. 888]|uniref:hypothetical protein n=1 Tax=Mycoplasma sp. 888 TaxID=3108483 RepID=UPI002D78489F|nr:hypothetical protein [Mycoplasma sp. 888]WRQ26026.1 hypothetical protein U5U50_01345 [Mycoplasma sp. 888]